MRKQYKLNCIEWNLRHVKFNVFDPIGANCGVLTISADDIINFVKYSWNGDIFWHGKMPEDIILGSTFPKPLLNAG